MMLNNMTATTCICLISLAAALAQGPPPRGDEAVRVAAIRQVGLLRDSSRVDATIAELKKPGHIHASFAALRSLAQLGAEKGIPAIDEVASKRKGSELGDFAVVARARIRADAGSRSIADPGVRALAKLDQFLNALGMNVNQLNARAKEDWHHLTFNRDADIRIGLFALREIADMIYRNSDAALLTVAQAQEIDFKIDRASELKILLAPLGPPARLTWLINELANKNGLREEDYFLIQLAIDYRLDASGAAASKLTNMRTVNRQLYSHTGFSALFRVIKGVGDKDQAPAVEPFLTDSVEWVRHYAKQTHPEIASGIPFQYHITY